MLITNRQSSRPLYTRIGVAVLIMLLSGCATTATTSKIDEQPPQPPVMTPETLYRLLAGEIAGHYGDMDTALKFYIPAAADNDDPRVAARAARIALYSKDNKAALQASERWYELEPNSLKAIQAVAISNVRLGNVKKTTKYLNLLIEQISEKKGLTNKQVFAAVAKLMRDEAETSDAVAILDALTEHYDSSPYIHLWLARFAVQGNKLELALKALNRTIELGPDMSEAYVLKGRILSMQGDVAEAIDALKLALDKRPDDYKLRLQYGRMLVRENRLEEATEQYQILHNTRPDDRDVLVGLGLLRLDAKQYDRSTELFTQLMNNKESRDEGHYYLGRVYEAQGVRDEAMKRYRKVKSGPLLFDSKIRIAHLLAKQGETETALKQLTMLALEQDDNEKKVEVYLIHGKVLREAGKIHQAMAIYDSAIEEIPNHVDLLYARALTAELIDQIDRTIADLKYVIQLDPDNAHALNALGYTLADRTDRIDEALTYIKQAIQLNDKDAAIMDSMGWVHYRMGKLKESVKWLRQAFKNNQDAEIAAHLGEVLWQMGKPDEARRVWSKGKELDGQQRILLETLKRFDQ